jgi:hypothetical protein
LPLALLGLGTCLGAAGCSSAGPAAAAGGNVTSAAPTTTTAATSVPSSSSTTTAPTTTSPPTTTTTLPPSFGVGIVQVTLVNPNGVAIDYGTGGTMARTLVTEIRYPTLAPGSGELAGAAPATSSGPFPVVVFAHGYDVTPDTYTSMLDYWVKAGFVVVAPLFPDENENEVAALGGPDSLAGSEAERDLYSEPSDLAFIIDTVAEDATHPVAGPAGVLYRLVDPSRLAIAGQSDGGDAVAALAYDSNYSSDWASLTVRPSVVAVLSGAPLAGTQYYRVPASRPLLVVVQSAADECNFPQESTELYDSLGGDKWFLELYDSNHLGPYDSSSAAALVVRATTAELFDVGLGLSGAPSATIVSQVRRSGVGELSNAPTAPPITPFYPSSQAEVAEACAPPVASS